MKKSNDLFFEFVFYMSENFFLVLMLLQIF